MYEKIRRRSRRILRSIFSMLRFREGTSTKIGTGDVTAFSRKNFLQEHL